MTPIAAPRHFPRAVAALVVLSCLAACSSATVSDDALDSLGALPQPPTSVAATAPATTTATTISADETTCEEQGWAKASYRPTGPLPPPGEMPEGSYMREIQEDGRLVVGVDENTLGFASRNTDTGEIEGFEVELARRIAAAIDPNLVLVTEPVLTSDKRKVVIEGVVDLTISANSMDCDRWQEVAFSTEYYTAVQQFLVPEDSPIRTGADLAGQPVCVTVLSSSERILKRELPDAVPYPLPARTDCLLALQEGTVAAYFGHDSFLYGMKVQDPTVEVREGIIPTSATESNYGIAINHEYPEFVRFVNAVLDEVRTDGTWDDLHEKLQEDLRDLPDATAPDPEYRD